MPDGPVDLAEVHLDWRAGIIPLRVRAIERETQRLLPLHTPGQLYDTYIAAIRYLSPPTLFENRPSYRLLDVAWGGASGRMTFGLATYFDKFDLSETVGHEYAAVAMSSAGRREVTRPTLPELPFRALIGDPFDAERHAIIPTGSW